MRVRISEIEEWVIQLPATRLSKLQLLADEERHQMLGTTLLARPSVGTGPLALYRGRSSLPRYQGVYPYFALVRIIYGGQV